MGAFWSWLTNDSYQQGNDAQYEWQGEHETASDVPDNVVRYIARQSDEDEEAFLAGWRDGNREDSIVEPIANWWVRLFG